MTVELINTREFRRRLGGVSSMFIHRRRRDDPSFPTPIRFSRHGPLYWRTDELASYIEARRAPEITHDRA